MSELMSQNVPPCPAAENHLSDKQQSAIELLILGRGTRDTADAICVDRRTVQRWKSEELFREELDRRRGELWARASNRLAALVNPALDVLESHLADRYEHIRFRAASAVLRLVDLKRISKKELEPQMDTDEHR